MTRVAVLGARGRMGSTSVEAIEAADDLDLVAAVDKDDAIEALTESGAEAALVFTTPDVAMDQVRWCVERGIHVVIGTSGFGDDKVAQLRELAARHEGVGILVVPNFSIGAVLMMRFAAVAAPFFESVEVIEMHHPDKVDAPSGTAVRTAEMIGTARREAGSAPLPDATTTDPDGARGATVAGVPVHAVRARGFTASQEVLFGDPGEIFSIRHDSSTRESFMPGVVAALRSVAERPGVTVGLDSVLGLTD
ncbi:4-hydroxy-tetrahydrodipicolinate reductase [Aeromicrobium sp. YIM 150415]|uniref:4-hydroxy-tetrahydrodipicolinate reductase n=1 Tax=Aeromicrobium sp. YIM 150415 TaxID=2803912 RepID=UPI001962AA0B|nr:4-hydroxy-tetrahydrodipicolinate reductase [Aeromicrobium sp. YIM 150415]MBM9462727.1 4-hydroxy-tetrahydrodipicolinate reductase [Aeromicrobium sp. YIM 150415]